jgi:hypothetical protein
MKRTPFQPKPTMPSVPHMGPISNQQTLNSINQEKYKTLYSKFQTSDYNELEKQDYENIDLSFKTEDGSIINAIISNDNLTETEIILLFKKFKNFSNLTPTSSTVKSIETPLHIACKKQYYTVIRYLIDNGFNRSIEKQYDSFGNLPIHYLFQNLTYDCKDNDYYQPKNFISNKQNKYKQKEIDFEKLLISSIHNHCKNDVKYKDNLNKNFDELIKLNKFYNIDEFTSIINDTQDKIKQLLIKKKLFIKDGDTKLIKENLKEISKDPEFIKILNEAQKNLSNKFDKYKIDNIENIEETFNTELQQANSSNDKENFKAIEAFNTNSNKLLEVGEQFRHNYFDDPLSLVFVYKFIYETIDTNLVDMLDNKTGDNQLNVITLLDDMIKHNMDFCNFVDYYNNTYTKLYNVDNQFYNMFMNENLHFINKDEDAKIKTAINNKNNDNLKQILNNPDNQIEQTNTFTIPRPNIENLNIKENDKFNIYQILGVNTEDPIDWTQVPIVFKSIDKNQLPKKPDGKKYNDYDAFFLSLKDKISGDNNDKLNNIDIDNIRENIINSVRTSFNTFLTKENEDYINDRNIILITTLNVIKETYIKSLFDFLFDYKNREFFYTFIDDNRQTSTKTNKQLVQEDLSNYKIKYVYNYINKIFDDIENIILENDNLNTINEGYLTKEFDTIFDKFNMGIGQNNINNNKILLNEILKQYFLSLKQFITHMNGYLNLNSALNEIPNLDRDNIKSNLGTIIQNNKNINKNFLFNRRKPTQISNIIRNIDSINNDKLQKLLNNIILRNKFDTIILFVFNFKNSNLDDAYRNITKYSRDYKIQDKDKNKINYRNISFKNTYLTNIKDNIKDNYIKTDITFINLNEINNNIINKWNETIYSKITLINLFNDRNIGNQFIDLGNNLNPSDDNIFQPRLYGGDYDNENVRNNCILTDIITVFYEKLNKMIEGFDNVKRTMMSIFYKSVDLKINIFDNKKLKNEKDYYYEIIAYLYQYLDIEKIDINKASGNVKQFLLDNQKVKYSFAKICKDKKIEVEFKDIENKSTIKELLIFLKFNYPDMFEDINYPFVINYFQLTYCERNKFKIIYDITENTYNKSLYYNKYKILFDDLINIKQNIINFLQDFFVKDNENIIVYKDNNKMKFVNIDNIYNTYSIIDNTNKLKFYLKNDNNYLRYKKKPDSNIHLKSVIYNYPFQYLKKNESDGKFSNCVIITNTFNKKKKEIEDNCLDNNKINDNINYIYLFNNQFQHNTYNLIKGDVNIKFKFITGLTIYKKIIKLYEDIKNIEIKSLIGFNVLYSLEIYYEIIDIIILLIKEYKNFIEYSDNKVINKINDNFLEIKKNINSSFTNYDKLMEEQTKYVNNLLNNYEINSLKKNYEQIYDYCIKQIEKIDNIIQKYNKSISFKFLNNINDDKDITDDFSLNKFQSLKNQNVFTDEKFFDAIYSKYKDNTDEFINDTYIILNYINYNIIYTNNDYHNVSDNFYIGINEYDNDIPKKINNIKINRIDNNIYNTEYTINSNNNIGSYLNNINNYPIKNDDDTYNIPIISIEYIKLILMFLIKDKIPDLNTIKNSYEEKTKEEKYAKYSKYKHFINDENLLKSLVVYYNLMLNKLQFKEIREIIKEYILTDDYEELKTKYEPLKDNKYEDLIKENPIKFDLLTNETDKVNNSRLINDKCYNSNTLIENSDILKQLNILDLTKQGHNIMNILIDQMNFKAISYIIDNESSLTHNGNYVKTMKDKNNLTPCEYARNKLNIIIGQYSSNGEELNSLLSFQSKIIDEINSDEKFNIGLQKDDTIKNIIMNCFYLFNEFIWLDNQNIKIKDLFGVVDEPLIKTLNEEQIFQSNIFDETVKEKLMDEYQKKKDDGSEDENNYKTKIANFNNNPNSINYENYEELVNVLKQDYIKIIKIVNANDVKSYSKINDLIFNNFENKMSSNSVDLKNYFNNINEKVCQTYYDLDKTINDDYNQTNMNIIDIIRLNIINIYVFEFNEIIKVYLKRINGVDYDIDNNELLKNIFYYVIVMELNLSGEETFESYNTMKEQFIIKVFKENGIEIENDERLNKFIDTSMDFYNKLIVELSKYFKERAINYIGNLQSISILLNIIEKLK